MKSKQIEKLLHGVVNSLCDSITDENVKNIIKTRTFITGGCIPCMLMGEWVNDYDFYFIDSHEASMVRSYFQAILDQDNNNKDQKYHISLITDNAINLSDKVQLIPKFVGTPEEVTKNFDWQHIKSYYDCSSSKLVLTPDVYRLICEKELVYTGSAYPLSSMLRLKKYLKKGWNVSTATMVHIALDISASLQLMGESRGQVFDDVDILSTQYVPDYKTIQEAKYNVEDVIYHLNGVDPLTIQKELQEKCGKCLTVSEIVAILYK